MGGRGLHWLGRVRRHPDVEIVAFVESYQDSIERAVNEHRVARAAIYAPFARALVLPVVALEKKATQDERLEDVSEQIFPITKGRDAQCQGQRTARQQVSRNVFHEVKAR